MYLCLSGGFFFFKQKTAYEMRISDWSSDVCSSDLPGGISISGQIVPPRTARGFRIGCDHPDAGPRQITPIPDVLRVSLAHQKDDRRIIGRGIMGQTAQIGSA